MDSNNIHTATTTGSLSFGLLNHAFLRSWSPHAALALSQKMSCCPEHSAAGTVVSGDSSLTFVPALANPSSTSPFANKKQKRKKGKTPTLPCSFPHAFLHVLHVGAISSPTCVFPRLRPLHVDGWTDACGTYGRPPRASHASIHHNCTMTQSHRPPSCHYVCSQQLAPYPSCESNCMGGTHCAAPAAAHARDRIMCWVLAGRQQRPFRPGATREPDRAAAAVVGPTHPQMDDGRAKVPSPSG